MTFPWQLNVYIVLTSFVILQILWEGLLSFWLRWRTKVCCWRFIHPAMGGTLFWYYHSPGWNSKFLLSAPSCCICSFNVMVNPFTLPMSLISLKNQVDCVHCTVEMTPWYECLTPLNCIIKYLSLQYVE